jgi:hypothetical protein
MVNPARTLMESRGIDTGNLRPETGSSDTSTSTPVSQETEADNSCTPICHATTVPGASESNSL